MPAAEDLVARTKIRDVSADRLDDSREIGAEAVLLRAKRSAARQDVPAFEYGLDLLLKSLEQLR